MVGAAMTGPTSGVGWTVVVTIDPPVTLPSGERQEAGAELELDEEEDTLPPPGAPMRGGS